MSETYELFRQGREHMAAGMNAQATVALEKAKRREPDKTSILEALGIAYFRIRRFAEAEQEFREILELRPVDHYAHLALGRCLEKQGRPEEDVCPFRVEDLPPAHLRERGGQIRPERPRRERRRTRRQPVHAHRGHAEGQSAELLPCGPAGACRVAVRSLLCGS